MTFIELTPAQLLQVQPTCCECYYCATCSSKEFDSLVGKKVDISDDPVCKAFIGMNPFKQMYLNINYPGREKYFKFIGIEL